MLGPLDVARRTAQAGRLRREPSHMSYSFWGRPRPVREPRRPHEKSYRRDPLADWDAKWQALSPQARSSFLLDVKGPARPESMSQPSVSAESIPPAVLDELVDAGFVEVREPGGLAS